MADKQKSVEEIKHEIWLAERRLESLRIELKALDANNLTADELIGEYEAPLDTDLCDDAAVATSQQNCGWMPASDPPGCPGPTLVILRRNSKVLHDEEFNAGHRTDIVDYGDHYLEIAKRWFNGNMWAGFGETVIMWQWLPEFPAELLFEDMEEG